MSVAVYLLRQINGMSYKGIGQLLGGIHERSAAKIMERFNQEIESSRTLRNKADAYIRHLLSLVAT